MVTLKRPWYCEIALLFSFFENTRHMGKETNRLTLIDVLGPLAQSAEHGAKNTLQLQELWTAEYGNFSLFLSSTVE